MLKENLGLFRNWALAFTSEGKIIRDELASCGKLSISDISNRLNQAEKDRFLAQRTFEELQYMGVAVCKDGEILRVNELFWTYAREFDVVRNHTDSVDNPPVWELIEKTELMLREIIRLKYTLHFGSQAEANIAGILGADTWTKVDEMVKKSVTRYPLSRDIVDRDPLSCMYFGDLMNLIINNKSWVLFKSMFKDKRQLEDIVKTIIPVRNDSAHFARIPPKEMSRCQINCDDLLVIVEKEMSAMSTFGIVGDPKVSRG